MSGPTFTLPACPVCSSWAALERPFWRYAANTSRKRGAPTYAFIGCKHAAEVEDPTKFRSDHEEIELIEEAWKLRVEQLFAEHTAGWPQNRIDALRRTLEARLELNLPTEGQQTALELPPADAGTHEQHEPHENDHRDTRT